MTSLLFGTLSSRTILVFICYPPFLSHLLALCIRGVVATTRILHTSYFMHRSDGSWESNGSSSAGLDGLMEDRKGRANLLWVALGANGEWCVRSKHGRVCWEGVSVEADEALADILAEDGENELVPFVI